MNTRLHVPIRCAALIDAPESAVRRALGTSDVWIRTATAVGGRLEVAGDSRKMRSGSLIRFRAGGFAGPVLLRVTSAAGLPLLESVTIRGSILGSIRIGLTVAATAAGTLATVEFAVATAVPVLNPMLRPTLIRYGEMLLGIATLVAREPVRVVAGALIRDGKVLLARRKSPAGTGEPMAGRWELPGGKVEPGETDQQALQRELLEELGLRTRVFEQIGPRVEVEPGVQLRCYRVETTHDDPVTLVDHDEYRWVGPDELDAIDLLDADRQLIDPVRAVLRNRGRSGAADPAGH